jgi:glucose/arabinose dehydrogenase
MLDMRRDFAFLFLAALSIPACTSAQGVGGAKCDADNAGLKLPSGFCVTVFAESLSGVRHMAVAPNGDVFASRQGRGGGVVALRDANHDGRADEKETVATGFSSSAVALFDGYLYTEEWARFLAKELASEGKYAEVTQFRIGTPTSP